MELYDLVGVNDLRFSPFCWRTKAALAYKKIPYTTVPVRFTDKDKLAFSGQDRVPVIKDTVPSASSSSRAVSLGPAPPPSIKQATATP